MSTDVLSSIQYSLGRVEQRLSDLTTTQHTSPLMALAKDGNKITTMRKGVGRALTAYFNVMLYPPGSFGSVSEDGDYPTATRESETQASLALRMFAMTLGYSEHALVALENDPSAIKVSAEMKIRAAVKHVQRKMADQFAGRGDGSVGRTNGSATSQTGEDTITLDDCPLCQVGDVVYSNPDRDFAAAGGESGYVEGATVTDVKYDQNQIVLSAVDTWDDGDVIHLSGADDNTDGAAVWVQGLQAAYDNVADNFQYDADDSATYDHCDTYLGLTRSSTSKANVQEYNVNGYPTMAKVQRLVSRALAHGAAPNQLVSLWNPLTFEKYCEGIEGYAERRVDLKLPGGNFKVPVIGHGISQVPVIDDYRIPRSKILVVDRAKIYRMTAPGGWNKRAGKFWRQISTGTAISAYYMALFDIWYNLAVVLPDTSCVGYGVTTT